MGQQGRAASQSNAASAWRISFFKERPEHPETELPLKVRALENGAEVAEARLEEIDPVSEKSDPLARKRPPAAPATEPGS